MFRKRKLFVFFLLIFLFTFLFLRLFYLQVISYKKFFRMAYEQHNTVFKVEPRRGTIFDRYMEPLAINLDSPSIYCHPKSVKNKEHTAKILAKELGVDREIILNKFNSGRSFVWIKRKVDRGIVGRIKRIDLSGVYFIDESKRNYPNDNMASHIIGFAGVDNQGLEGVELKFDKKLKGKDGYIHFIRDASRRTILLNEKETVPAQNGYNIVLTIDSVIQYIVEEELKKMARKYRPLGATAIVMDSNTGKILALANIPDYNLNKSGSVKSRSDMKNLSVSSIYEPGSVFKIVTASTALEENKVGLEETINCENGKYRVVGRVLHDVHPYDDLTFKEVIEKSSNIGTVKVAQTLGEKLLYKYIKAFGFGEKTGIDIPGEVHGISRAPRVWSRSDISTIPIGQGIAVTPIQLVSAISVIANGGNLVKPYIVEKITTWEGGVFKETDPQIRRKVLSEKTCEDMRLVLRSVVEKGTGRMARSKKYALCGKTGTAQRVNPEGGYYKSKYNATFLGFAPFEKPVISIIVVAYDPHPHYYGGVVAAPVFKNIAERTLEYLQLNDDTIIENTE